MTERKLGIMTFLVIFMLKNLDFLGGGGGGAEFGTIPPELRNVTDIADISV